MKQDIEIIRGTSNTLEVLVTDGNGDIYTPSADEVVVFGVKKKPHFDEYVLKKKVMGSDCAAGICNILISPGDTEDLPFGKYFYDVGLQSGGDYFSIIEPSVFHIKPNVTKWGDGS